MKNSLKALALVLASGSLLMTSCGDKKVYPNLDHSNIQIEDSVKSDTFTDETLDILYEKIHDSTSTGSDVRDFILDEVANQLIGTFKIEENQINLDGYDKKDDATKLAFVKSHKAYWDKAKNAETAKFEPVEPTELTSSIKARVETIKDIVLKQVVSKMFDEANSDLYKEHNVFKEYKFARDKFKTTKVGDFNFTAGDPKNIYNKDYETEEKDGKQTAFSNSKLIDSTVTKEDPSTIVGTDPMLHLDYYEEYINNSIMPSIIDTLLVEQYIFDNQYTTLSRTQARKVNFVSIATTETNNLNAKQLVNKFIDSYIDNDSITEEKPIKFDVLADAWKGIAAPDSEAAKLLTESNAFTLIDSHDAAIDSIDASGTKWYGEKQDYTFYKETEYGQLMLDYAKINDNVHDATSNSKQKEFSNSGAYTVEKGLGYKINDIKVKDYTTNTWGTKDTGFSSLPTSIKDTLFEYSVSLDTKVKRPQTLDSAYVELVRGHYFLKAQNAKSTSIYDTIVHYDESSKTFYLVEVEEALSQSKLKYTETDDAEGYSNIKKEEIAREIGYTMATGETYKNTAYLHYLEDCDIEYHDQSIYDFMKETYPDLFKDKK